MEVNSQDTTFSNAWADSVKMLKNGKGKTSIKHQLRSAM